MAENSEPKTAEPKAAQEQTRTAIRTATQAASDAAQRGTAATEHAGRSSAEALRRTEEAGAETMRHLGRVAGETARRSTQDYAEVRHEFVQGAATQFEDTMSRLAQVVQESAQEWRTVMQLPHLAGGGLQEIQRSVNGAVESVIRTNLSATRELFRIASPAAMAEFQQRFMREYLGALLEGSTAVVRAVRESAEQTLQPLEERMRERQQRMHRNGNGHAGRVADVMEREVRVANPEDSVQRVARLMREEDTGVMPVGEGDELIGMVTDRDVAVRLVAEGRDPARTKVREVMTADVRYVFEDEDLEHVAENMAEQQVRRLPVMNREKRLVGVVSLGDISQGRQPRLASKALSGVARRGGQHMQTAAE